MFSISLLFGLFGCVPGFTPLSDLTDEQAVALCQEVGEGVEYTCEGDGFEYSYTIGYEDIEDCDDDEAPKVSDDCEATVDDWRACNTATQAAAEEDPCFDETPDECEALYDCIAI